MTVADVKRAIDNLYNDSSVPKETTKEQMEELIEHIQESIEALEL